MAGFGQVDHSVSVVLPAFRKADLLRSVIASIQTQTHKPLELIVVVNGAQPDVECVLAGVDDVRVLRSSTNLGFAGGMNRGAAVATGKYLYLTANDIELAPDYLEEMVRAATSENQPGLFGGLWRNFSDRNFYLAGGSLRFGLWGLRTAFLKAPVDSSKPYDVGWIPGAAVFVHKEFWDILGGFRTDFFAHSEDIELCLRCIEAGGVIRVVPSAVLYHHEHPRGVSQSHTVEFHKLKNHLAVNLLHAPAHTVPVVCAKYFFYTVPRIAWLLRSMVFLIRVWWETLIRLPGWLAERLK